MKKIYNISYLERLGHLFAFLVALLSVLSAQAQINIRGDVYGGGKAGAVGTKNAGEGVDAKTTLDNVTLKADALTDEGKPETITHITINSGTVTTVFGGGEKGRTYGGTEIIVQGTAQVGRDELKKSVHGGIYGGGDGNGAGVFGSTNVEICGGTIPQKVYGGGNEAPLVGNTFVHLLGGNIYARGVFGGARMADIYGYSYVFVDGENLKNDLVMNVVYGGNDISGTITPATNDNWFWAKSDNITMPFTPVTKGIDKTWNAFVRTTNPDKKTTDDEGTTTNTGKKFFAGQLFGGGDGDYTYTADNKVTIDLIEWDDTANDGKGGWIKQKEGKTYTVSGKPTIEKTYIEIGGGTIGYVYGGGNAATVTENTTICINNGSDVVTEVLGSDGNDILTGERIAEMGLNPITTDQSKSDYQFSRVFGGNNKADMAIRPTWNLLKGAIDNLYSGGNAGDMTSPTGIYISVANDDMTVNNVFGGCRKAHVSPLATTIEAETIEGYPFPANYAARVMIKGGNINNVYGGCDVSGNIDFGTDVRIMSTVWHNVYGGGNGAYAYTDNQDLKSNLIWGDFVYDGEAAKDSEPGLSASALSAVSLNEDYRPNVANTLVHITGSEKKDTYIGSVYCGGNSATLRSKGASFTDVEAHLHIGSYVVANSVFLGSNGEHMKDSLNLRRYAGLSINGDATDYTNFSKIDLTDTETLNRYMRGVAVFVHPEVSFDPDYKAWTTKIGSFFCGGNVGSMFSEGKFSIDLDRPMIIYDKVVGGCNNANIDAIEGLFARYEGGMKNDPDDKPIADKVELNIKDQKLEPKRLKDGKPQWDEDGRVMLEWNTDGGQLVGGNIYGGCYSSGHVSGNVIVNLLGSTCNPDSIFGSGFSGVDLDEQGEDVLGTSLNVFGGGYGKDSEIRGNVVINHKSGYTFQIFGGGEMGSVSGDVTINLNDDSVEKATENNDVAEAEYVYGGGFMGDVGGNVTVNAGNYRVYDIFGGACNADIGGHTEVYIGNIGFPYIEDNVYAGNDLGGSIRGEADFKDRVRPEVSGMVYNDDLLRAAAYVEYLQGRVDTIMGGSYGSYEYDTIKVRLQAKEMEYENLKMPRINHAFVNFRPVANFGLDVQNSVKGVFGGSEGYPGNDDSNAMQQTSYVLIDIPSGSTNYADMEVFGAGAYGGVTTAVVDLARGSISAAYGASYAAGITGHTVVNVPTGSTISVNNIFGGAYGSSNAMACDAYDAVVNYNSSNARVSGAIYGGNNSYRRTLYGHVNINARVKQPNGYDGYVYGAGYGPYTWSQYTEVNINRGGYVYEPYGGGNAGRVLNKLSADKLLADSAYASSLAGYTDEGLESDLVKKAAYDGNAYNANVHIYEGGTVGNYCYAGGYGASAVVSGTAYIDLLGGTVNKDMYASGTSGAVRDLYGMKSFTATATSYVEGGTVRNVYGGGWRGSVGFHDDATTSTATDILGESFVIIGKKDGTSFTDGIPTVRRNVYGGGEGGGIFGTAHVIVNNGYIGYHYNAATGEYLSELDDPTSGDDRVDKSGNVFGGGYVANSYVDVSDVKMYGGQVSGSVYGGGEIGPIGRGTVKTDATTNNAFINGDAKIYKAGESHVEVYHGNILRNVFGGGRGKDSWNGEGYMTSEEKLTMDLSSKGYVFGKTDVNVYGGEIGTSAGLTAGYGNVFGGGDLGFVYSGTGKKSSGDGHYRDGSGNLTEDCRVSVKVCGYATEEVTINGTEYAVGAQIPNEVLNTLTNGSPEWNSIDQSGITIHNAVFAGGNVSSGDDQMFAFAKTVFGNATAAVVDVFCRDLISVGGDGVGGLYGDGNRTFVDGYRELNISNYGTDFYALPSSMDLTNDESRAAYESLTDRQRAIYVVKYRFDGSPEGNPNNLYEEGDVILTDEWNKLTDVQKPHWVAVYGVINEGRYINTVQRCDFCGIIGSRLVLRGAMDRAQENNVDEADYTDYTINRVGELSLNQWQQNGENHGCYFGIYNVVKLLGAVTSDVRLSDVRTTNSNNAYDKDIQVKDAAGNVTETIAYGSDAATYWRWKQANKGESNVNNASSANKIALASGVFLEIVESVDDDGTKHYGPVTGVIELDLLNVTPGEGGGYVYAKNIHGTRNNPSHDDEIKSVLAEANMAQGGVRTNAPYQYGMPGEADDLETSGNFVSSLKAIVDDCFPTSKSWMPGGSAAHYWYIRGEFYVYDQEVSAYTGSADAYSAEIHIPLTMVAQSNAKLRILNILPGLYADPTQFDASKSYYDEELGTWKSDSLEIAYDNVTKKFGQNDPISYWDWLMTNKANQQRFVTETYICREQVTVGAVTYYPGQGILPTTYVSLAGQPGTDAEGNAVDDAQTMFNITNGLSNDKGFVLTLDMSNPSVWTSQNGATFSCNQRGVYGQYTFSESDIISQAVYEMQTADVKNNATTRQATFVRTYVATEACQVTMGGTVRDIQPNAYISADEYGSLSAADQAHFELAKVCVSTFSVSDSEYYVQGQLVPTSSSIASGGDYSSYFADAWYCTGAGNWGGQYYANGTTYTGVQYCQLLEEERQHFTYNYDALDLLVSNFSQNGERAYPTFEELSQAGTDRNLYMYYYDGDNDPRRYSVSVPIDYTATYTGTGTLCTYLPGDGRPEIVIQRGTELKNTDFVNLPNDRQHYAWFNVNGNHLVTDDDDADNGKYRVYIVKTTFDVGGQMYNAGKTISKTIYDGLVESQKACVEKVVMTGDMLGSSTSADFYYCIEEYTIGDKDKYVQGYTSDAVTDIKDNTYDVGQQVPLGSIVARGMMTSTNYQQGFEVSGDIPVEQTRLYVPVTADYNELMRDRFVTVIFEYTYTESDATGLNFETRVEKHILNLRIKFKSGKPIIGKLKEPDIVLPLEPVTIDMPFTQEGAFPILKGGFEIYENESDAQKHRNGRDFTSGNESVYFYQDEFLVSYYAETRLGRSYSEPVPIHVANYQRMGDVITDDHHMYINHRLLGRNPKIYISDSRVSGKDYNELDAMKEMYDLANGSYGTLGGSDNNGRDLRGAKGLDFFVQADVAATRDWTSIGDETNCFQGNFHGNGHTLSNMSSSLFGRLCGNVHNTGVMGSFTGGGIADSGSGRIENCWVSTSGTPAGKAVIQTTDDDPTLVNCYYPETQAFTAHADGTEVTPRPMGDFMGGRVAYDLNRHYLEARYNLFTSDANVSGNPVSEYALYRMPDGTLEQETVRADDGTTTTVPVVHQLYYPDAAYAYVENFYRDGDFRFADGLKPVTPDMRLTADHGYAPVFPDDYLFFGQRLSYGLYGANRIHNSVPMGIAKDRTVTDAEGGVDNTRSGLVTATTATENRVYRAPAYFRNGTLGRSAMFNAHAAFAAAYQGTTVSQDMTAIDFTGGNGDTRGRQGVVAGTEADFKGRADGYTPLLDFERIDAIRTSGLTQNLMAYAPDANTANTANAKTCEALAEWFADPAYAEPDNDYRTIPVQDVSTVRGHVVGMNGSSYVASTDHFLVDKQDFWAPIAYRFDDSHRMWHQRTPDRFVKVNQGWDALSLPFGAELVTTQTKGELTHFYEGSNTGHEYWLREYTGGSVSATDATVFEAGFSSLAAGSTVKDYTNTFLYDYYYNKDAFQDRNADEYQRQYYAGSHTFERYPHLTGGTPYLLGLPGDYYYEFDLSGTWTPSYRVNNETIASPGLQTLTFVSPTGIAIARTDDEMSRTALSGYAFRPNYLNSPTSDADAYLLDPTGDSFDKAGATTLNVSAFRPYFTAETNGSARSRGVGQIVIGNSGSTTGLELHGDPTRGVGSGSLNAYAKQHAIVVESSLSYTTDVRIVTPAGITLATLTVRPGETVETRINSSGVYIVQAVDAPYTKKVTVRK